MSTEHGDVGGRPGPVRRLQIRSRQGDYEIVSDVRVDEMTVPTSDELPAETSAAGVAGCWFEVRDGDGRVLYRQRLSDPIGGGDELFERSGVIRRVDVVHDETTFELLVPDTPDGQDLVLVGLPSSRRKSARAQPDDRIAAVLDLRGSATKPRGRRGNR
jgi:hypothetical protein